MERAKEGRKEGAKEGRKAGAKEGRKEGAKEGRKEGWKEDNNKLVFYARDEIIIVINGHALNPSVILVCGSKRWAGNEITKSTEPHMRRLKMDGTERKKTPREEEREERTGRKDENSTLAPHTHTRTHALTRTHTHT